MDLIKALRLSPCVGAIPSPPLITLTTASFCATPLSTTKLSNHFCFSTSIGTKPFTPIPRVRKKDSDSEPLLEPSIVQELSFQEEEKEEEEEEILDEYEYGKTAFSLSNLIVSLSLSLSEFIRTSHFIAQRQSWMMKTTMNTTVKMTNSMKEKTRLVCLM